MEDSVFEKLHVAVSRHATSCTWLNYSEEIKGARTSVPQIMKVKDLVQLFHEAQPNLSFTQKDMKRIFHKVLENAKWKTALTAEQQSDWVDTMAKRIRVLLRHVATAVIRKPRPRWVQELGLDPAVDPAAAETAAEATDAAEHAADATAASGSADAAATSTTADTAVDGNAEFFYGWDCEVEAYWRARTGDKKKSTAKRCSNQRMQNRPIVRGRDFQMDTKCRCPNSRAKISTHWALAQRSCKKAGNPNPSDSGLPRRRACATTIF